MWRRPGYARARARTSGPRTRCWPTCARVPTSGAGAILTILAEDTPTILAGGCGETDYPDLDFRRSLRAFAKNEPACWRSWRRCRAVIGRGARESREPEGPAARVLSYGEWVAVPERPHLKQIERTLDASTP